MTIGNKGLTVIELLVAISILAIGLIIAAPNFREANKKNIVKTTVRQLKDELAHARITALEQNTPILLSFPTPDGEKSRTYTITIDSNDNCEIDAGETTRTIDMGEVYFSDNNLSKNTAGDHIVQWDQRGYPKKKDGSFTNGTITLTGFTNKFEIIVSRVGNIRIDQL